MFVSGSSGRTASETTVAVFNVDCSQSGRDLRQYLSTVAGRCAPRSAADGHVDNDEDDDDDDDDDQVPLVIVVDGLHRITSTPLQDVFASLLDVQLRRRSQQSCPWVGLTHGLGWVEIFQFLLDWVGLGPL